MHDGNGHVHDGDGRVHDGDGDGFRGGRGCDHGCEYRCDEDEPGCDDEDDYE